MGDWLKYVPIFLNLSHLLPDVRRVAELLGPEAQSLTKKWPEVKGHLDRVLGDPKVKELLAGNAPTASDEVKQVQASLVALGVEPEGGVDGIMGDKTMKAILKYLSEQVERTKS